MTDIAFEKDFQNDINDVILEDLINEYYKIKTEEKEYDNIIITTQLQFIERGVASKERELIQKGHEIIEHASDRLIEIVSIGKYLLSRIEEKINDTNQINNIIQKEIILPTLNQKDKDKFNSMDIKQIKKEKDDISSEMIKSLRNRNFKKFNEMNISLVYITELISKKS
jgi:hypothetical protein